jgi:hypothetical protein
LSPLTDDHYRLDPDPNLSRGLRTGKVFRTGDAVAVHAHPTRSRTSTPASSFRRPSASAFRASELRRIDPANRRRDTAGPPATYGATGTAWKSTKTLAWSARVMRSSFAPGSTTNLKV